MLAIHILFTLFGVVLFAPLLGIVGRLLLRLSGNAAIADQDIAFFLLSPYGLFAFIIFAGLFIGIVVYEQAAMLRIAFGQSRDEQVRVADALQFTAVRIHSLFLFSAHLVVRLLIVVLPFVAVAAFIAFRTMTDYDINYYLAERPPDFMRAAVLIIIVLAAGAAVLTRALIGWSLALPLVLFARMTPGKSFSASTRAVSGHRPPVLASCMLWAMSAIALGVLLLGAIRMVGGVVVPHVAEDLSTLAVVLGILAALLAAGNLFVTAATSGHFAALITVILGRLAPSAGDLPALTPAGVDRGSLITPGRIVVLLSVAAAVAVGASTWIVNDIKTDDDVLIVAHRGAAGRAPENTIAAVQAALDDQADWVEIDVQESADGDVIVVHDSDFMKLSGNPVKVWDVTREQLAEIDVGSWFASEFADERVPTLHDVLEVSRDNARVVIELKYYGHDEQLEQRVAEIVEAAGMSDRIAIMSLKYDAVLKMKQLRPEWTVGLLSATAVGDLSRLDADFLAVSMNMVSRGFVRRAHQAGTQVFAWTVNDPVSMSRMVSRGVDGIITDEPAMARKVLAERAELTTTERLLLLATTLFGRDFTSRAYRDDSP
jgi:glycerophosphoryl diester phosphodiesterase